MKPAEQPATVGLTEQLKSKKPRTQHARESKVKMAGNKFLLQSGLAKGTVYDKEKLFEQLD